VRLFVPVHLPWPFALGDRLFSTSRSLGFGADPLSPPTSGPWEPRCVSCANNATHLPQTHFSTQRSPSEIHPTYVPVLGATDSPSPDLGRHPHPSCHPLPPLSSTRFVSRSPSSATFPRNSSPAPRSASWGKQLSAQKRASDRARLSSSTLY